jgi:hypothetical protein
MPGVKKVVVEIDLEGNTTVNAEGFEGEGCKEATEPVARALGKITETRVKPEFLTRSAARQAEKTGG